MDTTFRNSKNSKISDPHGLLLKLIDKINLKSSNKLLLYQFLACTIQKSHIRTINLKY